MGFIAPQVTGAIINKHNDLQHWRIVFYASAVTYVVGNVFFVVFATAKEQPWNRLEGVEKLEEENEEREDCGAVGNNQIVSAEN